MMKTFLKIKSVPKYVWILLLILVVGIFVRSYNFHDWLRFSPDEARDATYISDAILGKANLPLLGPQSGNTAFYLGPLYYQMEYVSALIFGNFPDKLAYPDLFFSILAILMLFLYLRRYFSLEVALALDGLFSLSYFAIATARFASNPNSIPFFVLLFLYGLLRLMERENSKKYLWAIAVGVSIGVGIQLHTLLFLTMPLVAIVVCGYLMYQKNIAWRDICIALFFFLLMNTGQLNYELHNNGANTLQLFRGANSESSISSETFIRNISLITACQIQANIHTVIAPIDMEKCGDVYNIPRAIKKSTFVSGAGAIVNGGLMSLQMIFCLIFSIGGYILAWRFFRKEKDLQKRNFIGLFLFYNLLSLLVMIPVASQISIHYFNILIFAPFILLGLWMSLLLEPTKKHGKKIFFVGITFLFLVNVLFLVQIARTYTGKSMSDVNTSVLGEITPMLDYMIAQSDQKDLVLIDGATFYLKRFLKPFEYLSQKVDVRVVRPENNKPFPFGTKFFYIDGTKKNPLRKGETMN
ncbi:MAG: glycosyltransferase family 39 protein, partial [Candidatus Moraniibacteriota bacterium]